MPLLEEKIVLFLPQKLFDPTSAFKQALKLDKRLFFHFPGFYMTISRSSLT